MARKGGSTGCGPAIIGVSYFDFQRITMHLLESPKEGGYNKT